MTRAHSNPGRRRSFTPPSLLFVLRALRSRGIRPCPSDWSRWGPGTRSFPLRTHPWISTRKTARRLLQATGFSGSFNRFSRMYRCDLKHLKSLQICVSYVQWLQKVIARALVLLFSFSSGSILFSYQKVVITKKFNTFGSNQLVHYGFMWNLSILNFKIASSNMTHFTGNI